MEKSPVAGLPLLVYDGECSFCVAWVGYWKRLTGDRVDYAPYQEVAESFPEIPQENFRNAVQWIRPGERVESGAEAALRALACAPDRAWMLWLYQRAPGFAAAAEWGYRLVADHRPLFYRLTKLLWGPQPEPAQHFLTSRLFLKAIGLVYFTAFTSLGVQVGGLIGSRGVLPAAEFLREAHQQYGSTAYLQIPTLFWLDSRDWLLQGSCVAGAVLSLILILGLAERLVCGLLFVLYLSLVSAGQVFLSFQWDALLLESGFLALFLKPSLLRVWLIRWLLFRLLFLSGAMKLWSGDAAWRDFTALLYHYETQPLPTPLAWYAHQLPGAFQKASVAVLFLIELAAPFLIFTPRRPRLLAAGVLIGFQALIFLTGNYTFFNFVTIALCLLLLDDAFLRRLLPAWVAARWTSRSGTPGWSRWPRLAEVILLGSLLLMSCFQLWQSLLGPLPRPARRALALLAPFQIVNTYGLFSVMTTWRPEIVMEGSRDGSAWLEYEFPHKPGQVKRRPSWVAPHQPRLDWQLWFAALENYRENPWFVSLLVRLLEGSPEVLALLEKNPFPSAPPRYARAQLYQYRFTDRAGKSKDGSWWRRELKGEYFPAVSLPAIVAPP